jgi:hypothetical protein
MNRIHVGLACQCPLYVEDGGFLLPNIKSCTEAFAGFFMLACKEVDQMHAREIQRRLMELGPEYG